MSLPGPRVLNACTRGASAEAFQRLFTRDTRDAYRYLSNAIDREALGVLPWWKRPAVFAAGCSWP